ncbi:hypothetical protein RhiirA5_417867 [Rhizophagus irregularis]|uniref:Restriction of telomere capping protein 4 C-terminal domain-containing protein n=1 Tax=Rhizophagus irregularis TaxID=588596 RepID=A0A2N0PLJ4_9GLOM|nr:hypothetical protein RhiirA5_417867 [Rhizophagus irregularis]
MRRGIKILTDQRNLNRHYSGSCDATVIAETLRKLFIDTKILQEVLIPEAAVYRLIQEDRDITAEKARKIMLKSVRFGEYIHIMNVRVMCRDF